MHTAIWTPAYVALGSNLNDPVRQVTTGFEALAQVPRTRLLARSQMYRSQPLQTLEMSPQDQPEYVNAVAGMLTQLDAQALLDELKKLETHFGRSQPIVRWGPRIIDFDLLLFGDERIATDTLTVPHPGIATRNFVLVPLAEVAPDLKILNQGSVAQLAASIDRTGLSVIA